jgi:hypothetical protein
MCSISTGHSRTRAGEEDVDRGRRDVQVLAVREVGEERQDQEHVSPHEHALEHLGHRAVAEQVRQRVGHRRPRGRKLVDPQRDPRRVPQQQRGDDPGDHRQDEVGLAEVAALEALRAHDLADVRRDADADQHERREHVRQQREPALMPQPRERRLAVDDADHRDDDRRQQDHEAPEDERVHEARQEPLEQLLLAEDDHGLLAHPPLHVVVTVDPGLVTHPHETDEQVRPPREQAGAHRDHGEQGEQADDVGGGHQRPERALRISAVIAGTISARSPMTA